MPQPFNGAVMTDSGAALLARAQAGECSITFTRMTIGNGEYTEEEKEVDALRVRTDLMSPKNDYPISVISIVNDTTVRVVSVFTNRDSTSNESLIEEGYYVNEIGLFARESERGDDTEVLYSIAVTAGDEGDYMPEYDGYNPAQITQEYFATVDNSANVTLVVSDDSMMLVSIYDPAGGGKQVAFEDETSAALQTAVAELNASLSDGSVTKIGTQTVGGTATPIYLNGGTPTACNSTVGSATKPVYMSNGTITASGSTVGAGNKPVYLNSGTITAFSSTYGGSNQPVYLNSGTVTTCNSMVPQAGGVTMTGNLVGPTATDYTTSRFRNIRFGTSVPTSLNNGEIYIVYE